MNQEIIKPFDNEGLTSLDELKDLVKERDARKGSVPKEDPSSSVQPETNVKVDGDKSVDWNYMERLSRAVSGSNQILHRLKKGLGIRDSDGKYMDEKGNILDLTNSLLLELENNDKLRRYKHIGRKILLFTRGYLRSEGYELDGELTKLEERVIRSSIKRRK